MRQGCSQKNSALSVLGTVALLASCLSCKDDKQKQIDIARRSVFKIQVISQEPQFITPWQRKTSSGSSGSGFYIGDGQILTNAHVVAHGKFITVSRDGDPLPREAEIQYIAHDADLAILVPKDKEFLKGVKPLKFAGLPKLQTPVSTIGYPMGGDQLSITDGVVSRISFRRYAHSGSRQHLLVQVDSAINPGNSGGPVMQGNDVVGVAFQSYVNAENTGYIIPTSVVERFQDDVEDGIYDGHPDDGLDVMEGATENPSTAAYHGLNDKAGSKVARNAPYAPTFGLLREGDVLLEIDGYPIGADGRIEFEGERVEFNVVFDLLLMGDEVDFKVMRDGKIEDVAVKITPSKAHYFRENVYAEYPRFYVYAGLVFIALSRSYLQTWGQKWFNESPVMLRYMHFYGEYDEELSQTTEYVVLSGRLPDQVNSYVSSQIFGVLKTVNGVLIHSLEDLQKVLMASRDDLVRFDFWNQFEPVVIPCKESFTANKRINETYSVSPDQWLGQ